MEAGSREADSRGSVLVCFVTSQCWSITSCDRVFSELSGACYESLLGRDLHTILHPAPLLHDSAEPAKLQRSTHWFAYAPDLPPVVMTTTLLPSELGLQSQASSGHLVACHFSRAAVPGPLGVPDVKPSSVPCSPLLYDADSCSKSLYVRAWSLTSSGVTSVPQVSPRPSRPSRSPRSFEEKRANPALRTVCRKPPLAPYPPGRRSLEDAESNCITCNSAGRAPSFSCPPSSHAATDLSSTDSGSNLQFMGTNDIEGDPVCPTDPGSHPYQQAGTPPSIPNEMGSRGLFLANMSHELRTPLNGTVAVVELLLSTNVSPEQRDLLQTVLESSQSLTRILSSILDFAQLDSGLVELSSSPLNICDMVESCVDMVWPDALKKGLEVTVSAPRAAMSNAVLGDSLRIRQVLVHLLSNAVKFTDQGSVEVEVQAEETETGLKCALKVKDTGVGVPESFRPLLFDSFTQATESCTRTHGGLGLGLAICFNLAKLMRADLSLSNREGGGTTATLSLCMPFAAGSCASARANSDVSSGSAPACPDAKAALVSPPSSCSLSSGRKSTDSADSAVGGAAQAPEAPADAKSVLVAPSLVPGQSRSFAKAPDAAVSLHGNDTSIPHLLADPRIRLLQRHTAVLHRHSAVVAQQLRCACSALGMAVMDMVDISSPQSLQSPEGGDPGSTQLRGTPILICTANDASQALRNGWKKHPVVAVCMDGHLSHNLRVHVSPVSMPVKIRALISAVLLALHGGPGKDSLLHVPLGTPQTVAKSAGVSCTAGFGGTACGFCTRCQRHTDAAVAAALQRRSLDNSALERFPQRLSVSKNSKNNLAAVVEGPEYLQSTNSCASSESNWAAPDNYSGRRSGGSTTSSGADSRMKLDFVLSACTGTESDRSEATQRSGTCARTVSPAHSLTECTPRMPVSSFKLPEDAVVDVSNSPVRPDPDASEIVGSAPAVSVCASTAMLGAQMQQGGAAKPVPVLATSTACTQQQPAAPGGMRRSISAGGITQQGRPPVQSSGGLGAGPSSGLAMQSFLYRSTHKASAALAASTTAAEAGRRGTSSDPEDSQQSAAVHAAPQPSTTVGGRLERCEGAAAGLSTTPPARRVGPAPRKVEGGKIRLLIAEDNKINQLVVRKVVRKVSPECEIDVVDNGEAALLTILERPGYDLVLMDIHMPKMDGLETTRRVRETHPTRPMIVALTADTVVGMRQKCLQAGMQDYITKPFHVKDMQRVLQNFQL